MAVFTSKFRVYYEDTDLGGVVYHSNYLKFCERARTDFTREVLHFSQKEWIDSQHKAFVVGKLNCVFKRPAHFEDELTVSCIPCRVTPIRCEMYQEITNQKGEVLFALVCTLAAIDAKTGRVIPLDEHFSQAITPYIQSDINMLVKMQ